MSDGRVVIDSEFDGKPAEKGFSDFQSKMENAAKKTENAGKTMTAFVTGPIVAAGAGLLGLATKAGNYADRILDLNSITGMSTDSIQEWQNVAKVAGVNTEAVTNASQKLTKQLFAMENGTGKSSEALNKLGIGFEQLDALSPDERMDVLINSLAGIEDPAERARLGTELFGGSWQEIAPIVSLGAEEIDKARQAAQDMGAVMGEDALNDANNFRIEMENLKTQFGALFNEIGAKFAPLLTETLIPLFREHVVPAVQGVIEKLGELVDWFMNLSPTMQQTILVIVGVVAAIGPLLIIIGKVIAIIPTLITVVKSLGTALTFLSANPVGLIIAAIAALIAIGVLLWKNWDTVKEKALSIWGAIKDFFAKTIKWISDFIDERMGFVGQIIKHYMQYSRDVITAALDFIKNTFRNVLDFLKALVRGDFEGMKNAAKAQMDNIQSLIENILNAIKRFFGSVLGDIVNLVRDKFNDVLNFLTGLKDKFFDAGKNIIQSVIDGIKNMASKVKDTMSDIAGSIRNFLPFSPAKEGPLRDLNKLDFGGPITDSIKHDIPAVQRQLTAMLQLPITQPMGAASTGRAGDVIINMAGVFDGANISAQNVNELEQMVDTISTKMLERLHQASRGLGVTTI